MVACPHLPRFIHFVTRSGNPRAHDRRGSLYGHLPLHRGDGLHDKIVKFQRFDQIGIPDKGAVGDANISIALTTFAFVRSLLPALRRCGTPRSFPAWLLHFHAVRWARHRRCGTAQDAPRHRRPHLPAAARGPRRRDNIRCADGRSRPNTTRSMSEFDPSRLAPWTDTHATHRWPSDPARPVRFARVQHFAVIIGRDATHIVMHSRQHGDRPLVTSTPAKMRALSEIPQAFGQHIRVEMVRCR